VRVKEAEGLKFGWVPSSRRRTGGRRYQRYEGRCQAGRLPPPQEALPPAQQRRAPLADLVPRVPLSAP